MFGLFYFFYILIDEIIVNHPQNYLIYSLLIDFTVYITDIVIGRIEYTLIATR